nr:DUF2577 domain-containing protein [Paenibacillus phocaensis]
MGLANKIRQLGAGAVDAASPVAVLFGKVTNTAPLEIQVDQRFTIDRDFLVIPAYLTRYELDWPPEVAGPSAPKAVIREGLAAGDNVLLLRMQGGQKYIVWDKVVSG